MKRRERHERTLRRRRDFLLAQVAVDEGRNPNYRAHYDRAEIAALSHALAVMEDADRIGLGDALGQLSIEDRQRIQATLAGGEAAA